MKIIKFPLSKELETIYKQLKNSGINKEQTQAIINAIKYVERDKDKMFVTQLDIQKIYFKIEKVEMKLIIKLGAMMAFWSSLIVAIVKIN
ncbi:MAG: hypothetical protein RLN62_05785 [Rickettsiales bacterium]